MARNNDEHDQLDEYDDNAGDEYEEVEEIQVGKWTVPKDTPQHEVDALRVLADGGSLQDIIQSLSTSTSAEVVTTHPTPQTQKTGPDTTRWYW